VERGRAKKFLGYIASNVRRQRMRMGITQEKLAELASLEPSFVQKVERGIVNLSLEALVGVADALDTTPANLLRRATPIPRPVGRPKGK